MIEYIFLINHNITTSHYSHVQKITGQWKQNKATEYNDLLFLYYLETILAFSIQLYNYCA